MFIVSHPSTSQAQQNIFDAIDMVEQGEKKKAAQWLESSFRTALTLPSLSHDLFYYADAVIRLDLVLLVTHPKLQILIARVQNEQPSLNYPEALLGRFPDASAISEDKNKSYSLILDAFKLAQHGQNPEEARRLVNRALENFRKLRDMQGELEALHFSGRVEHELENLDQAMIWYDQALEAARLLHDESAVARVMHERARIFQLRDYNFIKAEEGYRYALNYYADQKDEVNLQVAINGLTSLAEGALSYDEFYLPLLEKEGAPIGSPAQYLHIRGVAIKAEFLVKYDYYMQLLIRWAGQELERDLALARYIIEETSRIAELRQDEGFLREIVELDRRLNHKERI